MSLTKDLREYAENAIEQGRHVLGQALEQAQGQLNETVGTVADLGAQAQRAINVEAMRAAVDPYLDRARGYTHSATELAEDWLETARKDPRLARAFDTAESVAARVAGTVQTHVLQPVQTLTGRGTKPVPPAGAKPVPPAGAKPAAPAAAPPKAAAPAPAGDATTDPAESGVQPARTRASKATRATGTTRSTTTPAKAAPKAPSAPGADAGPAPSAKRTSPRNPSTD